MALRQRPTAVRRREPRVLNNPFEFAFGIGFAIICADNAHYLLTTPDVPPVGIMALPLWLLWVWIITIGVGGVLLSTGLLLGTTRLWARAAERAGLYFTLGAWGTLAVAEASFDASTWGQYGQALCVVLGCGLRLVALHRLERAVKAADQAPAPESQDGP